MPTTYTIDISCDGPTPTPVNASSGDKIIFHNTTGAATTIAIDTPGVFNPAPGGTISLPDGGSSNQLTVGNVKGGTTKYEYPNCGEQLGPRSGRINTN